MTAFSASQFRSHFGSTSIAESNLFNVEFSGIPGALNKILTEKERAVFFKLKFRIQMADLPSRQFETVDRRINGPARQMPMGLIYQTMQLEVIEDSDYTVRSIFDKWQSLVFNQDTNYKVSYYDDIVVRFCRISGYNRNGDKTKSYDLIEAFPINISQTQIAWANENQYLVIPIELSYREWRSN